MSTSTGAPVKDPSSDPANADFQNYLAQWEAMQAQEQAERAQLASALAMMMAMVHSGNAFGAMRIAELDVMPSFMGAQGDQVGAAGATENLSSGLREFMSELQNAFNEGSAMTLPDATNFSQWFQNLYNTLTDSSTDSAISPDTKANLLESLNAIGTAIAGAAAAGGYTGATYTPGKPMDPQEIMAAMKQMFPPAPPAGTPAGTPVVPPQIGDITNAFQELNANVSTLSATQTSREQFLNNLFNQLQGVLNNMYQSDSALMSVAINNEKSA